MYNPQKCSSEANELGESLKRFLRAEMTLYGKKRSTPNYLGQYSDEDYTRDEQNARDEAAQELFDIFKKILKNP